MVTVDNQRSVFIGIFNECSECRIVEMNGPFYVTGTVGIRISDINKSGVFLGYQLLGGGGRYDGEWGHGYLAVYGW